MRRALAETVMCALAVARSGARVTVLRAAGTVRVAAVGDSDDPEPSVATAGTVDPDCAVVAGPLRTEARWEPGDGGTEPAKRLSAVVIDDHPAVRAGIVPWLSTASPPINVRAASGEVESGWAGRGSSVAVVVLELQLVGTTRR
ncbi:hypothetical protein [Amycolatopsis sp. H20-H5]|uniref:hypothetical protein n=1 Tax=Amycolatopsis sp. H20-H5 TaxID=3046309 RepID=UPI002DBD6D71|nr:hypothetical protein [Amycolatopsis sp. H20-H5]MEC3982002.1 hypothetical protein [Amycolatopsis sp. H20-H5]